jgi:uncharacterized protein (UPF0333 family)
MVSYHVSLRSEFRFVMSVYADCLLKNTSTKHNKYVVNQKHEQVLVGSTGKDDSDLPKAVQVHIPSNVFRFVMSVTISA